MNIVLNGDEMPWPVEKSIEKLLKQLNLLDHRIAVEINCQVIPRSQYRQYMVKDGDCVEIVHAIGGG